MLSVLERSPTNMSVHYPYVLHMFVHTQWRSVKLKVMANEKRLNTFRSVPSLRVQNVEEISALYISQRLQSEVQMKREKPR